MESRPITDSELEVVRWLIEHARTPSGEGYSSINLERLHVIDRCHCGCASVDFELAGQSSDARVVADAIVQRPNGTQAGVILWGSGGHVTGLELYNLDPDSAKLLPSVAELRTWEGSSKEQSHFGSSPELGTP